MSSPSTELSEAPGPPATTDEPLTSLDMPSLLSDLGGGATSQKEQQSSDSVTPSVEPTMSTLEMMGSGSEPSADVADPDAAAALTGTEPDADQAGAAQAGAPQALAGPQQHRGHLCRRLGRRVLRRARWLPEIPGWLVPDLSAS